MSVRKQYNKTQTIELKVVLVERSFSETNVPVALTLVTVIAQSSEKIASVKATLRRFSMRSVLSLYHRGVRCSAKKTVEYYHSLSPASLWQARLMEEIPSGQPKTAIDISNDGKQTVLMVPSSMSISSFRDILYHRLAVQPEDQHLSINKCKVNEKSRIRDYGLRKSAAIMVLMDEAQNSAESSMKYVNFSRHLTESIHRTKRNEAKSDVLVREVVNGLNIEGICCTPSCPVFGNNAIHRLGFEEFDMCQDAAFCPLCHGQLHITNAGFHNCCWRVQGIKKTGHPMEMKSGKTDDEYVRCDPSRGTVSGKWSRLMLHPSPQGDERQCVVCRSLIDSDDYLRLNCGDCMHHSCHRAWQNIDRKCPSCLLPLKNKSTIAVIHEK